MFLKFFIRLLLVLSFSSSASAYANVLTDVSINSINYESLGSFQKSIQENLFDKNSIDSNANDIFKKISDKKLRQLNIDVLSGEFVSSEFLLNYEDFINNNFEFSFDVYSNSVDYLKEVNKYNANINYHLQTITTNSLAQQFSISTNFDVITSQSPDKILSSVNIGPGYILGTLATVVFVKDALDKGCTNPRLDISLSSSSMTEGGSTVTLTATIEKPLTANLVVPITTSGTATSGFDYQAISSITISAGDLTGTATITSIDDSQYESSTAETIIFTASNVQGSTCPGSTMTQTLALADDDNAPTAQLSASASSIAEDAGSSIILTATLSSSTYEDVTVALGTSGTSTEGTDYTTISDITISAGSVSASTNFTPTNDTMYETATAETAIIDITGVTGGSVTESGTQQVSLSITADSDAAPTVTFASSASSVAENGSDLTITATLSNPTYETVTVTIDGTGGSATEGTDFATVSDITITSGNTTGTAAFNPTVDSLYDAASSEAAGLSISGVSGGGATESGSQTASITITDSDSAPTVTLSSSGSSVGEAGSDLTLTATLSVATYQNVVVALTPTGTGTEGTDYATISDITVNAGATTGTTAFNPTDDSGAHEDTETAIVAITGVSGGGASENGTQSTTISIVENDAAPTVTLATSAASIAENAAGTLTLTATLSVATFENVTVALDPTGTATEGTDYGTISNITVSAGDTSGTATFDPTDDSKYESATAETSVVAITSVSGGNATESGTQTATISITENEAAPTVTLAASSTTLDENSNTTITLTATLSGTTYEDVTVALTPSGTADEGSDYKTIADITIAEDATTGTTSFETIDDCTIESGGNETANVAITGVSGGEATENSTPQVANLEIDDDEGAPRVTLASSASSITEGSGSVTLTASIGICSYTQDIVVSLGVAGTATEGTDYNNIPSSITISQGDTSATQALTPVNDSLYDAASNETSIISITGVSGGDAAESGTQSQTITIVDAQSAPTVTLAAASSSVGEDGSNVTVTATTSPATYADITVSLSTSGTATDDTDYALDDTITISAGSTSGTATFNPTSDSHYDATSNESATIAISGVSGGSATESGTQTASITIVDAESAPTLSITTDQTTRSETDADATLTASLTNATYADVTVAIATSGTAVEGTDYADMSNITISAGDTSGTVAFNPTVDNIYDALTSETAVIDVTVSGGSASENGTQQITYTLTDAQSAPTVNLTSSDSTVYDSAGNLTITATLSVRTFENVTVAIDGTGGSATEGSDFAEVSDITVTAGNLTGTTTFNPTQDSTYEGTESATLAISGVTGGGATENGTQTASISITEYALNLASLYVYEGDSTATTFAARYDYINVGAYQNTYLNPYTNVNLHKAWAHKYNGNYLTGTGTKIAVVDDDCFNPAHEMFADKTITYHNSSVTNDNGGGSCDYSHGMHVASIAAGQISSPDSGQDGLFGTGNQGTGPSQYPGIANPDGATIGVAPDASLYYASSSYEFSGGYTYRYDALNDVFGAINSSGSDVINNSWGYITCHTNPCNSSSHFADYRATELVTLKSNNPGLSYAQLVAYAHNNHGFASSYTYNSDDYSSTSASHVTDFVNTAVNYMTNTGVIVWANSNYANSRSGSGATGADVSSGLPYFFTDLQKAWITVINVDVQGSSLSSGTANLQGATCGLAAAWCLAADGQYIYAASSNNGGTPDYDAMGGTSMASPIVSGGVALLTQAFPNHTPEQIVDRLLASANNTWIGTHTANLSLSNGVTHGYNTTYGHGMMDLYSALAPILSNDFSRARVYTGRSIGSQAQDQSSTGLRLGTSFGRSAISGLSGMKYYYYDALDGGFEAYFNNVISYESTTMSLSNQLRYDIARLNASQFDVQDKSYSYSFGNVLGEVNTSGGLLSVSIDVPNASIQYFNKLNSNDPIVANTFTNPFTDHANGGIGMSYEFNHDDKKVIFGFHDSGSRTDLFGESDKDSKTLSMIVSQQTDSFDNITLLTGLLIEENTLLDSKGSGALGFHGTNPHSLFAGINLEKIIGDDLSVQFMSTIGYSTLDNPSNSLVGSVSPISSSSLNLSINKYGLINDKDKLSVSISQPNRVESGTMTFRIPSLAQKNSGNITYTDHQVELSPSGRQVNFGIDYVTQFENDLILGLKHTVIKDLDHNSETGLSNTFTISGSIKF